MTDIDKKTTRQIKKEIAKALRSNPPARFAVSDSFLYNTIELRRILRERGIRAIVTYRLVYKEVTHD